MALGLCAGAAVPLGLAWAVLPRFLPQLTGMLVAASLAVVIYAGLALAQLLGRAVPGVVLRWVTLAITLVMAGSIVFAVPSFMEPVAARRGMAAAVVFAVLLVIPALGLAAVGVWYVLRKGPPTL